MNIKHSFFNYLEFEKRYSVHTLVSYKNDINQFQSFLSRQFDLEDLLIAKHTHVRTWIVHMMQNDITGKSINRKISALKSFYNFMKKQGLIKKSPMLKVTAPKVGKRLPKYVESKQIETLLTGELFEAGFSGDRDALIIDILYSTGIRRAELIGLKVRDVNHYSSTIKVYGKGSKERIIPVSKLLLDRISTYIITKEDHFKTVNREFLLVTDAGKPLYPKFVFNKVKQYLAKVTTLDKKSPHILRHSFATHLANNGAELNAIKALLGHSSLAATQVYTHNTVEQLKAVYKNAHPKAKTS